MRIDVDRVKRTQLLPMWRRGGGESLVKIMGLGARPDPDRPIGYCTQLKFVAGRLPREIENLVGLREGTKLADGAEIFLVRPLPQPAEFDLAGYSNTPEGISTTEKAAHPDYPPGLGVPQWNLLRVSQAHLLWLASLRPHERFRFDRTAIPPG